MHYIHKSESILAPMLFLMIGTYRSVRHLLIRQPADACLMHAAIKQLRGWYKTSLSPLHRYSTSLRFELLCRVLEKFQHPQVRNWSI